MLAWSFLVVFALIRCECKHIVKDNVFNRKLRDNEYSIYSLSSAPEGSSSAKLSAEAEREQLYEAYNLLHTLAQDFHKPFDSPAVIVVGHQTSGKSALIEAIMGFQYNQVGGGTKTRRPVALRMQYNPNCIQPLCFLTLDNGKEEQKSLSDIQAYIESENKRLEKDPTRSFDPREINIRMEYKYCPNMIMIDTPGMIQPPRGRQADNKQRAIQQQSKEAESLILSKIRCQDYIILCVEDTTDWKHATTRNIVSVADPTLSRTVLVSTKLDTKLPQFSEKDDLLDFLNPVLIQDSFKDILGGPFHTSVPSGRVGITLTDNEEFVTNLRTTESRDRSMILSSIKSSNAEVMEKVGVSRLRAFLEAKVEECYRKNVARIIPLLQVELRNTERNIAEISEELQSLSSANLKEAAMKYRDRFINELSLVIQGTVRVSAVEFGETLESEQLRGGVFYTPSPEEQQMKSKPEDAELDVKARAALSKLFNHHNHDDNHNPQAIESKNNNELSDAKYRLFGGAQYHRALKEFNLCVRTLPLPRMTAEDVANAAGVSPEHDGADYMRAACVIAMEKAKETFDPVLNALEYRAEYIMKKMFPIVSHLLAKQDSASKSRLSASQKSSLAGQQKWSNHRSKNREMSSFLLTKMKPFQRLLQRIFDQFVEETLFECTLRCRDDLHGMTEFVTFDVEDRGGSTSLYSSVPTPKKVTEIYVLLDQELKKQAKEQQSMQYQREQQRERRASLEDIEDDDEDDEVENNSGESDDVEDLIAKEWAAANGNTAGKHSHEKKKKKTNQETKKNQQTKQQQKRHQQSVPSGGAMQSSKEQQQLVSLSSSVQDSDIELSDYYRVLQVTEEMVKGGSSTRTLALVTALVQYIISSWRIYFARTTSMKFNSFFLMSFKKKFPNYLREQLELHYDGEMDALFDMSEARRELQTRLASLNIEREQNEKLQQRFERIEKQLRHHNAHAPSIVAADGRGSEEEEDDDDDDEEQEQFIDLDQAQRSSANNNNNHKNNKKKRNKK